MARVGFGATVGASFGEGQYSIQAGSANTATAAVADAVAVLVADGASPTEAHVTDLNNAWTAYLAAAQKNVTLDVDNSVVTSMNALRRALDALLLLARASGKFTGQ